MNDYGAPPEPPVPSYVDLRDYGFMPLDVLRLRDSDLAALASGDEFKCAVLLWCVAWHQVPAGSLPDDDRLLARHSGAFDRWRKVKAGALRGFAKCTDGRLYHPVIAEKALVAWEAKQAQRARTAAATAAREAKRRARQEPAADERDVQRDDGRDEPRNDKRHVQRHVQRDVVQGIGTGRVKGDLLSEPNGSGAGAPPDSADVIFALGVPLLTTAGVKESGARSMLGLLRKQHGDSAVIESLRRCAAERPLQPVPWLQAALKPRSAPNRQEAQEQRNKAVGQEWLREQEALDAKR